MYFKILITCVFTARALLENSISPKEKIIRVNVIAPPLYVSMYEQTRGSLGTELVAIASSLAATFNNATMAKSNGYRVGFELTMPVDNPIMKDMNPSVCEGSVDQITDILNTLNNYDNTHHYILLFPCSPLPYTSLFNSVGIDIPIIESSINVQCAKRLAIFYEFNLEKLYSSFSNALLKTLNAPSEDFNTVQQTPIGDDGFKTAITIKDDTIYKILNSKCFLNSR